MNDERQSRLLADFLAVLRQDANAAPPADLDADLAAMARLLVAAKAPPPDAAVRERVWQRALAANRTPRASANGRAPHLSDKENTMTSITRPLPRGRSTQPFTLAAALAVVAMAALLFFSRPPSGSGSNVPGMLGNPEQQEATATPLATLIASPTATPLAALITDATATPLAAVIASPTATPMAAVITDATATPLPSATPTIAFIEHRIRPGETLGYIIQLYGYTDLSVIDEIVALNPTMTSADRLPGEGSIILIPLPSPVPTPFAPTVVPPTSADLMPAPSLVPMTAEVNQPDMTTITLDPAQAPTVVPPGWMLAEPEPIRYGDSVQGLISEAQPVGYYSFEGAQDDVVTLRVSGENGYDTRLSLALVGPNPPLAADDDGGPAYDPEIYRQALPEAGEYVVLVEPVLPGGGRFTLTLERAEPLSLDEGPQQVRFNGKGQFPLVFDGVAGQTLQLNARAVAGSAGTRFIGMRVFQDGAIIADISRDFNQLSAATEPAGAVLSSGTVTVPQDGRVRVDVVALTMLAGDESLAVEIEVVPAE